MALWIQVKLFTNKKRDISYSLADGIIMIQHDTVVIIVEDSGKFLLIKRGNIPFKGQWSFPGGHVDEGETTYQAAAREAKEEVGEVQITDKKPFFTCVHDVRVGHRHTMHAFRGAVIGEIEAASDAAEFQWLSLEEMKKMDITDYTLRVLNGFFVPEGFSSGDKE